MSPGHDGTPTTPIAGATNRQNRNNSNDIPIIDPVRSDARLDLVHAVDGCEECGGRLGTPKLGRSVCPTCHLDFLAGLRRRREAEMRTQPLSEWGCAS